MIEQKLISILLKFPERFEKIYGQDSLFFDPLCKIIFHGMQQLFDNKQPINLNSVWTLIKCDVNKLNQIHDLEITDTNFNLYFDALETIRLKNKVQILNNTVQGMSNKNKIVTEIENIISSYDSNEIKTSKLKEIFTRYLEKYQKKDRSDFIEMPINFFQKYNGNFLRKEMVIIAARPNVGKTTYMMNLADELSKKYSVGIITTEQTEDVLTMKILSSNAKVMYNHIESYMMTNIEEMRIAECMQKMKDKRKMVFLDRGRINDIEIEQTVRKMIYENNIDIVFIDYLQRILHHNEKLSAYERVSKLSNFFKSLAKDYNLLVVPLAQVKRNDNKEPTMEDLKGSGDIEQDADKIIILHEHEIKGEFESVIKHIVAKNKTGPKGFYFTKFEKDICKFTEL